MNTNKLGRKYSLKSILKKYDRIEIPVIQRDYAQGRTGKKETKIRNGILDHILNALTDGNPPVELDFVYGVEHVYRSEDDVERNALVPIDGQQRLTTLWLIHWFLAGKAGLFDNDTSEIRKMLLNFSYETRVSSKDFLNKLCTEKLQFTENIKNSIIDDTPWFDESWKLDPSVMGFLTMLDAIANHKVVKENEPLALYKRLTDEEPSVTFYFLPLEKFGLGEEIYTRMNARGKVLTEFERFKSNFFKIIDDSPRKEEISQKIEYDWVTNLWPYRGDVFVIDGPFMNWLRYITMMLSVNPQTVASDKDNIDYLDMDYLAKIYTDQKNIDFLIHAFDSLPKLRSENIKCSLEWDEQKGLAPAVERIMDTENPTTDAIKQLIIFGALKFLQQIPDGQGLEDFVRVTRNLIANTPDRSMREWPVITDSILKLISTDVYSMLRTDGLQLSGLRTEQRKIECFKAKMIGAIKDARDIITLMDENSAMKAREGNLIIEMHESKTTDTFTLSLDDIDPTTVDCIKLKDYFKAFEELQRYSSSNDFEGMWGELLQTPLYTNNNYECWWNDGENNYDDYANHPVMMDLVRQVVESGGDVESTITQRQCRIIRNFVTKSEGDLSTLSNPKDQLYLLYVATIRLLGKSWKDFFVCNRFNFGWVEVQSGYTSPFQKLLEQTSIKIFQTFPQKFRSDTGVVNYRTPYIMNANVRGKDFFTKLLDWVNMEYRVSNK